mmetsp:Transcript_12968/g.23464  ORF Transcript_12968/g.23464 Transcript_12968/m.23464 type:complete len:159 (+) Transcript_12968:104-580(+)
MHILVLWGSHHQIIIMPWPFCPSCRATLKVDSSGDIDCVVCEYSNNLANLKELPSTTTYSSDRPVPLWAKSDEEQKALQRSSEPTRATVEEPCVKCGHGIVGFYTVQMRSVDEGQTVFYECPACKHCIRGPSTIDVSSMFFILFRPPAELHILIGGSR